LPDYESNVEGSINATLYQVLSGWGTLGSGRMVLTQIEGSNDLMFSWNDWGFKGTNRLVLAAADSCTEVGGALHNFSGHWFAPASPGWGMNMLGLQQAIPATIYFYDTHGFPRWLFASYTKEGDTYRSELLQPTHGSYPTWSYERPVLAKVGSASLTFDADDSASFNALASLFNTSPPDATVPLQGSFAVHGDHIIRATDTFACAPP